MRMVFATLMTLMLSSLAIGQEQTNKSTQTVASPTITERQVRELPQNQHKPPKLTLQQALKIAERFIAKEKIDASSYYLFEAKWVLYGGEAKGEPRWYFWWVNINGSLGDYHQITVSMEGKVQRLGSM